jgi:hypothetical protein
MIKTNCEAGNRLREEKGFNLKNHPDSCQKCEKFHPECLDGIYYMDCDQVRKHFQILYHNVEDSANCCMKSCEEPCVADPECPNKGYVFKIEVTEPGCHCFGVNFPTEMMINELDYPETRVLLFRLDEGDWFDGRKTLMDYKIDVDTQHIWIECDNLEPCCYFLVVQPHFMMFDDCCCNCFWVSNYSAQKEMCFEQICNEESEDMTFDCFMKHAYHAFKDHFGEEIVWENPRNKVKCVKACE